MAALNGETVVQRSVSDLAAEIKTLSGEVRLLLSDHPEFMEIAGPRLAGEGKLIADDVVTAMIAAQTAVDVPEAKSAELRKAVDAWVRWADSHVRFLQGLKTATARPEAETLQPA
jgi:hypothetical protein